MRLLRVALRIHADHARGRDTHDGTVADIAGVDVVGSIVGEARYESAGTGDGLAAAGLQIDAIDLPGLAARPHQAVRPEGDALRVIHVMWQRLQLEFIGGHDDLLRPERE